MERDHQDPLAHLRRRPNRGVRKPRDYIISSEFQTPPAFAATTRRALDTRGEVLGVLDDVLSLKGRSASFRDDMTLMSGLPELDSMAVANVLTALEERFGFTIDDDEIDASTFETVGTLVEFVRRKRAA